jgi:glycosyltransferase involved in cell wall biosynthesis
VRILFFNQAAAALCGEMNRYVIDVAERLRIAGDKVALVHSRTHKIGYSGTRYVYDNLDKTNGPVAEAKARLEAIVADFNPDVIQIHGVSNIALDRWLPVLAPTVRFIHNHSFYCSGGNMTWQFPRRVCLRRHSHACLIHHIVSRCGPMNGIGNILAFKTVSRRLAALRSLSGIQVATEMMKKNLLTNGFSEEFVTHIPLYAPAPRFAVPKSFGNRRVVLHTGGLVPKKGVRLLATNIHHLPDDVDIVFTGGGPLESWLHRFAHFHNLTGRIRLVGELQPKELDNLHGQATILAMPSMWNEPLGLAGLYAMAHGKPIIAFQSSGIREWMCHGVNGIAVPFGDRAAFIVRLRELLADPALLESMGENGRRQWERKYRPARHVANLREYYSRLTGIT